MRYFWLDLKKHFVMPIKENGPSNGHFRNVALSKRDLKNGSFVKISDLVLEEHTTIKIWLEDVPFPLLLAPAARMGCKAGLREQRREHGCALSTHQ